jgi:cell division protein FtsL
VPKKKLPARKTRRLSTAQIVFLVLTVVITLSLVLSLVNV